MTTFSARCLDRDAIRCNSCFIPRDGDNRDTSFFVTVPFSSASCNVWPTLFLPLANSLNSCTHSVGQRIVSAPQVPRGVLHESGRSTKIGCGSSRQHSLLIVESQQSKAPVRSEDVNVLFYIADSTGRCNTLSKSYCLAKIVLNQRNSKIYKGTPSAYCR